MRFVFTMGKAALLLLMLGMGVSTVSQQAETSSAAQPISVVIQTDHEKYSLADDLRLDVRVTNAGCPTHSRCLRMCGKNRS